MTLVDGGNLLVALQDLQTTLKGNVEVPIIDTDFGSHNRRYVNDQWQNIGRRPMADCVASFAITPSPEP